MVDQSIGQRFINSQALKAQALRKDTGFQDREEWSAEMVKTAPCTALSHWDLSQLAPIKHRLQHNNLCCGGTHLCISFKIKGKVLPCSKGPSQMNKRCLWHKGSIELLMLSSAGYGTFWFSAAQALPAKPEKHIFITSRAIQNYHIALWNLI